MCCSCSCGCLCTTESSTTAKRPPETISATSVAHAHTTGTRERAAFIIIIRILAFEFREHCCTPTPHKTPASKNSIKHEQTSSDPDSTLNPTTKHNVRHIHHHTSKQAYPRQSSLHGQPTTYPWQPPSRACKAGVQPK